LAFVSSFLHAQYTPPPKAHRPTPFQASIFPGAGCPRLCTTARFLLKASAKPLTVLNTHLDHYSDEQRKYGASLLLIRGRYEAAISDGPVLLMGDFNSPPTGAEAGAYEIITGKAPPVQVDSKFSETYTPGENQLPGFKFLDTRVETRRFNVSGNFATFTGWSPNVTEMWARIDFVLGGSNRRWCVQFRIRAVLGKGVLP
jgi:endonuclease/exonuclease/phosphatase family metal-dependent hydrolase